MADPKLRRRIALELKLQADDWTELLHAFGEIERRLHEADIKSEDAVNVASGGCGSGWTLSVDTDPAWTAERYREALNEWSDARRKQREADRG